MTPDELRKARETLGLTPAEAARVLETDVSTVRRMERDPSLKTAREAPARVARLYRAYLAGFRPEDWPEHLIGREERLAELERVRVQE